MVDSIGGAASSRRSYEYESRLEEEWEEERTEADSYAPSHVIQSFRVPPPPSSSAGSKVNSNGYYTRTRRHIQSNKARGNPSFGGRTPSFPPSGESPHRRSTDTRDNPSANSSTLSSLNGSKPSTVPESDIRDSATGDRSTVISYRRSAGYDLGGPQATASAEANTLGDFRMESRSLVRGRFVPAIRGGALYMPSASGNHLSHGITHSSHKSDMQNQSSRRRSFPVERNRHSVHASSKISEINSSSFVNGQGSRKDPEMGNRKEENLSWMKSGWNRIKVIAAIIIHAVGIVLIVVPIILCIKRQSEIGSDTVGDQNVAINSTRNGNEIKHSSNFSFPPGQVPLALWTWANGDIETSLGGRFKVYASKPKLCLDVLGYNQRNGSSPSGTEMGLWDCDHATQHGTEGNENFIVDYDSQDWKENQTSQLILWTNGKNSGYCLQLEGVFLDAKLLLEDCDETNPLQKFKLQHVENAPPLCINCTQTSKDEEIRRNTGYITWAHNTNLCIAPKLTGNLEENDFVRLAKCNESGSVPIREY